MKNVPRTHHHHHEEEREGMKLTSGTVSRINSTSDQAMNAVVVRTERSVARRETRLVHCACTEPTGQE